MKKCEKSQIYTNVYKKSFFPNAGLTFSHYFLYNPLDKPQSAKGVALEFTQSDTTER